MRKRNIYHYLVVLLFSMVSAGAYADTAKSLVVEMRDGSQTVIPLADKPVITVREGTLRVVSTGQLVEASLADVRRYTLAERPVTTDIQRPMTGTEAGQTRYSQGHVYVTNARQGDMVRVYSLQGHLLQTLRIDNNGNADIDLTELPQGVYVVKTSGTSMKILKK